VSYGHVEDLAELYALGALTDPERVKVDEHLRVCTDCARLVGASERDVALIASSEAQSDAPAQLAARVERMFRARPSTTPIPSQVLSSRAASRDRRWRLAAAMAAAFLVGILPSLYFWNENRDLHRAMLAQSGAMERLALASHRTSTFWPTEKGRPAQVLYAPDGSWYLIVVRGLSKTLAVVWMHDGAHTMLGDAVPHGGIATLYLPKSHRMDRLALMDGGRIVAEATLSWGRTPPSHQAARSAWRAAAQRES
jgi:Putative zinc-finger